MADTHNELIQILQNEHPPATDWEDATLEVTTMEVWEMMQEFIPDDEFTIHDLHQVLKDAGYQIRMKPGKVEWVWLMR